MEFYFFTLDGSMMFTRNDAEIARWSVEEMSLEATFPIVEGKPITDSIRIGFYDPDGVFQPFEIRKATVHEPDHYVDLTAEHIAISELTDYIFETADIMDKTAGQALTTVLSGTGWSLGTNTASGTSWVKLSNTDVWNAITEIKSNWNVYITPRVIVGASGITGKYLDIAPAAGTFNGVRVSINKNADTAGITYDDSKVKTAVYGWGHRETTTTGGQQTTETTTFRDVVWAATDDHPAKPSGREYIEDPDATEIYGRNGTPRFGFYQNADISDGTILLQKTWDYLKTVREPQISIDLNVVDLYQLGYVDAPLHLHDIAVVEVEPLGQSFEREITKLQFDLLYPEQTSVTIGDYIPNIVYIAKETSEDARGGGGGGGGQNNDEYKKKEFETQIKANDYQISLRALQRDVDRDVEILYSEISLTASNIWMEVGNNFSGLYAHIELTATQIRSEVSASNSQIYSAITQTASSIRSEVNNSLSGVYSSITQTAASIRSEVNASNSQIYSAITQTASSIRLEVRNSLSNVYSSISQQSDRIDLVVTGTGSKAKVNAASIVLGINSQNKSSSSYVDISADYINLSGYVTASQLSATDARITNLTNGTTAAGSIRANQLSASSSFSLGGHAHHNSTITIDGVNFNIVTWS